jgi:rhamnose utilization protein RhaD (predicted bifunctional aldolase and dehydrogenase)
MTRASLSPLANLWDEAHAATLDEPGQLLYRSNLLGSDLRITNFGGGNTSAKVEASDPLTKKSVRVLWVNPLSRQARGAEGALSRPRA